MSAISAPELDYQEEEWLDFLQERRALTAAAWVEEQHPRFEAGTEVGGQFRSKWWNQTAYDRASDPANWYRGQNPREKWEKEGALIYHVGPWAARDSIAEFGLVPGGEGVGAPNPGQDWTPDPVAVYGWEETPGQNYARDTAMDNVAQSNEYAEGDPEAMFTAYRFRVPPEEAHNMGLSDELDPVYMGVVPPGAIEIYDLDTKKWRPILGGTVGEDGFRAAAWDESKHPRHPEGSERGGEFRSRTTQSAPFYGIGNGSEMAYAVSQWDGDEERKQQLIKRAHDLGYEELLPPEWGVAVPERKPLPPAPVLSPLERYTQSSFYINAGLRGVEKLRPEDVPVVKALDKLIEEKGEDSTPGMIVFRGDSGMDPEIDTRWDDPGFLSTTTNPDIALDFSDNVMEFHVEPGTRYYRVPAGTYDMDQEEVIFPRGMVVERQPDGTFRIWEGERPTITAAAWDESKHPREPAGSDLGGQFSSKDGPERYKTTKPATLFHVSYVHNRNDILRDGLRSAKEVGVNPALDPGIDYDVDGVFMATAPQAVYVLDHAVEGGVEPVIFAADIPVGTKVAEDRLMPNGSLIVEGGVPPEWLTEWDEDTLRDEAASAEGDAKKAVTAAAWNEADHPRAPAGDEHGGQFISKHYYGVRLVPHEGYQAYRMDPSYGKGRTEGRMDFGQVHPDEGAAREEAMSAFEAERLIDWGPARAEFEKWADGMEKWYGDHPPDYFPKQKRDLWRRYQEGVLAEGRELATQLGATGVEGLRLVPQLNPGPGGDLDQLADTSGPFAADFDVSIPGDPHGERPGFTVWNHSDGSRSVEDVLDITDTDFFPNGPDSELVTKYVALVDAARGASQEGYVTLYRGMSDAEADAWHAGEEIPLGKFFTSIPTVQYAMDRSGAPPVLHTFRVPRAMVTEVGQNEYQLKKKGRLDRGEIVQASAWVESEHPREPGGTPAGGQFAKGLVAGPFASELPLGEFDPKGKVKFWPERLGHLGGEPYWKALANAQGEELAFWFTDGRGRPHHTTMEKALGLPVTIRAPGREGLSGAGDEIYDPGYDRAAAEELVRRHRKDIDDARQMTEAMAAAAGWDESKHPRHPAGSEKGGEFMPLYHGTNVALKPGEIVTTAKELGYNRPGELPAHYDPAVVYMSTGDHLAERYAVAKAGKEGGEPHVYEVEPVGEVLTDPEAESGFGTDQRIAPAARVVREVKLPGLVHWSEEGFMKRGPKPVTAAAVGYTGGGGMVCLYPTEEEAQAIARRNGQPAEDLHVTLLYFEDGVPGDAAEAVSDLDFSGLEGQISGIARFQKGEDGVPVVGLVSAVGLNELRAALAERLPGYSEKFGFVPHMTLGYDKVEDPEGAVGLPVTFSAVKVKNGGDEPVDVLTAAAWDESKHPRHPGGSDEGGEFAPKESAAPPTRSNDKERAEVISPNVENLKALRAEINQWPEESKSGDEHLVAAHMALEGASRHEAAYFSPEDEDVTTRLITVRRNGKLIGIGDYSYSASSDVVYGGSFGAVKGGGLPLFAKFLDSVPEGKGATWTAGGARAEVLYERAGIPSDPDEPGRFRLTPEQVQLLRGDMFALARALQSSAWPEIFASGWSEADHPRWPAGSERGGEFAPKDATVGSEARLGPQKGGGYRVSKAPNLRGYLGRWMGGDLNWPNLTAEQAQRVREYLTRPDVVEELQKRGNGKLRQEAKWVLRDLGEQELPVKITVAAPPPTPAGPVEIKPGETRSVMDKLTIGGGRNEQNMRTAVRIVDQTMRWPKVPGEPTIEMKGVAGGRGKQATFWRQRYSRKPDSITLAAQSQNPISSVTHELGHYLDSLLGQDEWVGTNQPDPVEMAALEKRRATYLRYRENGMMNRRVVDAELGRLDQAEAHLRRNAGMRSRWSEYSSEQPAGTLRPVMDALKTTAMYRKLQGSLRSPSEAGRFSYGGRDFRPGRSHVRYLLHPTEMIARSFEQFIAAKNPGSELARTTRHAFSGGFFPPEYPGYLHGQDLQDVNAAWEKVLKQRGLLKKEGFEPGPQTRAEAVQRRLAETTEENRRRRMLGMEPLPT